MSTNLKEKTEERVKHEHVIFKLDDKELRYHDTRKFGKMYLIDKDKLETSKPINELGLEPWDNNLTTTYLKEKYSNKVDIISIIHHFFYIARTKTRLL